MSLETARAIPDPSGLCVYTTLIGQYEALNEQPTASDSRVPYICLTDDPGLRSETWQIRLVETPFDMDPIRSQRDLKIRAHRYLGGLGRSLYIDNSVLLKVPAEEVLDLVPKEAPLGLVRHSFRNSVLDEFLEVAAAGLDDSGRVFEQLNHYQLSAPDILQSQILWTGLLVRDHADEAVRRWEETWYAHVLRYSRRDQLSVNLALQMAGLTPHVLTLDNHESDYYVWPRARDRRTSGIRRPSVSHTPPAARLHFVEKALSEQVSRTDKREQMLSEQTTRADALQQALAKQSSLSEAVLSSRSWRLLRPARRVGQYIRRVPGRWQRTLSGPALAVENEGFARETWYLYFRLMHRIRRQTRGRRWLVVGPDEVTRPFLLWKVTQLLGVAIVRSTDRRVPLAFRHDGSTIPVTGPPEAETVVNGRCTDVSKRRVEQASITAFGYGIAVDPTKHMGPMVEKSDNNATHDGAVITGPILAPDPSKVYQRVLDNEVAPGIVEDLRTTVVAGTVVFVSRKRRQLRERFAEVARSAVIVTPETAFTAAECSKIGDLTNDMGVDMGELDIVRDRRDGRIYVVDVNSTPFSPGRAAFTWSGIIAMHRVAAAFEREWGRLLGDMEA